MKKTLVSIAVAAMALFAISSASAQSQEKKDDKKVEKRDGQRMQRPQGVNPFEGLNLTEAQQNSLKALAEEQKAQRKEKADDKKADRQKESKERIDAMKNQRKEYLAKIKAILTPEQYVQFLENNYLNQQPAMGQGRPGMQGRNPGQAPRSDNARRTGSRRKA